MLNMIQFFIICATLVQCSFGAPWDTNNDIREFDLEWQCEQFCNRLKGKLNYNANDSSCTCTVDNKDQKAINSNHLEQKLNDLGFNFKIIDQTISNRLMKRDTAAEKIKKLLAERNQKEVAADVAAVGPKPESEAQEEPKEEKLNDKLHRLRAKLLIPKSEKSVITAPENLIVGKAAPNIDKTEKASEIKNNVIVGQAAPKDVPLIKESENVENKEPDTPANDKLSQLRLKLSALKNAKHGPTVEAKNTEPEQVEEKNEDPETGIRRRLPHLRIRRPLGSKIAIDNNNKVDTSDRILQLRERIRNRLQNKRAKTLNEDGHEEE